jgi:ubiquinone biosynthesis monooxygenase Coq7
MSRQLSQIDRWISAVDVAVRSLCVPKDRQAVRKNPAEAMPEPSMSIEERRHVAGLMRVNHSGEVCAQALYQGQSLTAKLQKVKDKMTAAALEEVDHLAWCEARLHELDSSTALLNPLWYGGSFMLGLLAGLAGDQWSLGFVAETERQVTEHLKKHIRNLPKQDIKTRAILSQMQQDETQHAQMAQRAGAAELPWIIKKGMQLTAKLMTKTSYYI